MPKHALLVHCFPSDQTYHISWPPLVGICGPISEGSLKKSGINTPIAEAEFMLPVQGTEFN